MAKYFQEEIECMPVEKIKALQDELLPAQVRYVWENVEYYRNKMKAHGVTPDDIKSTADLHKLPFMSKLTACWLSRLKTVCVFNRRRARRASALSLSTRRATLTFGRTVVRERSWRRAAPMRTFAKFPTATDFSRAVPVSTAARTKSAA